MTEQKIISTIIVKKHRGLMNLLFTRLKSIARHPSKWYLSTMFSICDSTFDSRALSEQEHNLVETAMSKMKRKFKS